MGIGIIRIRVEVNRNILKFNQNQKHENVFLNCLLNKTSILKLRIIFLNKNNIYLSNAKIQISDNNHSLKHCKDIKQVNTGYLAGCQLIFNINIFE